MSDLALRRRAQAVVVLVLVASLLLAVMSSAHAGGHQRTLSVMTRNLYLGTDLAPFFTAGDATELQAAITTRWAEVQTNDFTVRAEGIAAELAEHRPHLVGLQEASLWRTGTLLSPDPAGNVAYDFLAILLDALEAAGAPYRVVTTIELFDGELPALALGFDLRLTDRQAILVRADAARDGLRLHDPGAGVFDVNLQLPIPVPSPQDPTILEATRGWTSVDGVLRGSPFRFVNTHLEAFHPGVRTLQANELLAGPLDTALPVVLVGDVNSPAPAGRPEIGDLAYPLLTGPGGFTDVWSALHPGDPGLTCCFADDLRDATATLGTRIDVVFVRGPFTPLSTTRVGDELGDRVGGLWPSDHAGVVAVLGLPAPGHAR